MFGVSPVRPRLYFFFSYMFVISSFHAPTHRNRHIITITIRHDRSFSVYCFALYNLFPIVSLVRSFFQVKVGFSFIQTLRRLRPFLFGSTMSALSREHVYKNKQLN
jgi:hypothetical protein